MLTTEIPHVAGFLRQHNLAKDGFLPLLAYPKKRRRQGVMDCNKSAAMIKKTIIYGRIVTS